MKLLFWLVLLLMVILALKKKIRPSATSVRTEQDLAGHAQEGGQGAAESMVCCVHCQVYLPASEAVRRGEQVFCCTEHADQK